MKKLLLTLALVLSVIASQAQVTVQGSKFTDNWSITLKGGMVSPYQHFRFFPNARGIAGVEIRKQITTYWGLGVEGEWTVNTSSWRHSEPLTHIWDRKSDNVFDHQLVGLFTTFNLTNLLLRYKGEPRFLDVEAHLGAGWAHAYYPSYQREDQNSWYTKAGLNIGLNLGESKAWTLALKPAVVWYMGHLNPQNKSEFNANYAMVELEAGLTYHFKNSNGKHYMTLCPKKYTQEDLDEVNARVNDLRNQLAQCNSALDAANAKNAKLQADLDECLNRKPDVVEVVKTQMGGETLVNNVFFAQGKSNVSRDQMPNVERVAIYMKNHPKAVVDIKGYASPEGSKEINERLANQRAATVKDLLVKKYKIASSRITAQGLGVGDFFAEPDWNRVSVCTIETPKDADK
ncbi:MAG: OmpA family protein [Muribaculaceae bacterium]|nr:OmpA family protein [Muribaculaceae bacterium]